MFAILAIVPLLGFGCSNKTKQYFSQKQACAQYVSDLESKLVKDDEERREMFQSSRLEKVCYVPSHNTCVATINVTRRFSEPRRLVEFTDYIDILTGRKLRGANYYYQEDLDTSEEAASFQQYLEETQLAEKELACAE